MEQTECSETSAYKIQTPGNYPEENIQHTEHGESLKSGTVYLVRQLLTLIHDARTRENKKQTIIKVISRAGEGLQVH